MVLLSFALATGLIPLLSTASPLTKLSKRSVSGAPLMEQNFPDPSFIKVDSTYYAFATNSNGKKVPIATSTDDFGSFQLTGKDALPNVGAWSTGNNVWASDVMQLPSGSFVLYYSAESTDPSGLHCVGAATSSTVDGEYTPLPDVLACPIDQGGAIDPAGFIAADGAIFVTYKIDGNAIGSGGNCNNGDGARSTPLMLQAMEADGVTRVGSGPEQLLDRGEADGPLIEAPSLSRIADEGSAGGWLHLLFFSSNCYDGGLYDTSYAYSTEGVHGPYTKAAKPLLVTGSADGKLYSPGGMDTAIDIGAEKRVLFHADLGQTAETRQMWGGTVDIDVGGRVVSI